ncbi:MAG: molybdopterin-dependent oxidoreductase, partial [Rubrobacter sp.]|nr:molybdopterin-dependent oxidoreductase [Rubrobacter sp.]
MTLTNLTARAIGAPLDRIDGEQKVRGAARYAFEHPVTEPLYLHAVQAAIANGRVSRMDTSRALEEADVVDVITHENAPRLASTGDRELQILQDDAVGFRGQFIGAVIAETPEAARYAASLVEVSYDERPHDVTLSADRDDLYAPERVNAGFETDTDDGDVEGALSSASVTLDRTYTTPMEHNNPMEPHASIAVWQDGGLTLYDSTQGVHWTRQTLAPLFGLEEDLVRVISPHVGGGFGSKGLPHANVVLVALAAR